MMDFRKMEGCGNDFVLVAASQLQPLAQDAAALAAFTRRLCDRHFGLGADGLLTWEAEIRDSTLQVRMSYWNADGSRAEMCGNGARCVVRCAWEECGRATLPIVLTTDLGPRSARIESRQDDAGTIIAVDMGIATWRPREVPFEAEGPALDLPLDLPGGTLPVTALAVGNPHAVVFVDTRAAWESIDLHTQGRALATHPRFRHGANASFVFLDEQGLHLRVWERGSGPTLACGTASCAALAAARRTGRLSSHRAAVFLPGGRVEVRLDADDHLWLAGPARTVATGRLDRDWLATVQPDAST